MIINLLPYEHKMSIKREYRLRVLAVSLIFLLCIILLASVLLFPTYIFAIYRAQVLEHTGILGPSADDKATRAQLTSKIHDATQNLFALSPSSQAIVPTQVISLIMKDKTPDNFVTSLTYTPGDKGAFMLNVKGIAKTRESLLAFANALRREPGIAAVDLPISNFAGDSSITFSFDVTGETQK